MNDPTDKIRWFQNSILPYQAGLCARIRRIAPTHVDIDDVVAETLAKAYAVEDWSSVNDGRAFIYRIARNLLIDQARRAAIVSLDYMADLEELSRGRSYEGMLSARDELRRLETIIAGLPRQQRKAFVLRRVHGYTIDEIAAELNVSVSTVEKHVSRALSHVTREMMKCEDFAGERLEHEQGAARRDRAASRALRGSA